VSPRIQRICPDLEVESGASWWCPASFNDIAIGDVGSTGGCRPYLEKRNEIWTTYQNIKVYEL